MGAPDTVAYCHCRDCRRVTAAPVAAFAAFRNRDLRLIPERDKAKTVTEGVSRWFCPDCGSQLMARFDYLPDQSYVPLGILDQADQLPPEVHCHAASALPWLHIDDALARVEGTARATLRR
ncbi:MAG: GFA family protein [Silicimonas sp.]|nr:GFA family protein [Silicimonas sp.]